MPAGPDGRKGERPLPGVRKAGNGAFFEGAVDPDMFHIEKDLAITLTPVKFLSC